MARQSDRIRSKRIKAVPNTKTENSDIRSLANIRTSVQRRQSDFGASYAMKIVSHRPAGEQA